MSKRFNLREFQQGLTDRIEAQGRGNEQLSWLGVQIAGQNWLVDMADLSEVLPVPVLTPVPHSKRWMHGVANVRGSLYCVTDMSGLMGQSETTGDPGNRIMLLSSKHAFNAALLVERVLGLRDIKEMHFNETSNRYVDAQDIGWQKLDVQELLGRTDFLQIGR